MKRSRNILVVMFAALLVDGGHGLEALAQAKQGARPATSRQQAPRKNVAKSTTLTVTCNVPNATVTQDGIILGTTGSSFEVDPGNTTIDVSAPGYQTKRVQTVARPNVANRVNVVLVKAVAPRKPAPVARKAQPAPVARKARPSAGQAKGTAPRKAPDLFGDDFAGASSAPAPLAQGGAITGPASNRQPRQPVQQKAQQQARQQASGQNRARTAPQQAPSSTPRYEPGYGQGQSLPAQPGYQQQYAQPYQQPYQQAPVYPGYQPYQQYPSGPGYAPGYGQGYGQGYAPGYAPPGYAPGYAPGYPAPGYGVPQYQQAPSPYYYYPQQPPVVAAPVAPTPVDPVAPPSVSEAPLPSVAEAPGQSGPPPTDELAPPVSATKKASTGRNPIVKYLPFGAGQYQNGNYVLGGAFTAAQAGALVLYVMNSSNAATAQSNYNKAITQRDEAVLAGDKTSEDYYDEQANQQKAYGTTSDQNATLCLLGFGAAWAASTIEASINAPAAKGSKKSRGRKRGLAFETGFDGNGLEAQLSYNF